MPKPPRHHEPQLAWAYVSEAIATAAAVPPPDLGPASPRALAPAGGEAEPHCLCPVTARAHPSPRSRPPSFCPVCLGPVTLKLGSRVRHHYAHAPESACRAATGEGALRLSAKLRLAQELCSGRTGLALAHLCHRVPGERSTERCSPPPVRY